jgi:hypothetical protein
MDDAMREFKAYWALSERMIADATKTELAETARILALQAAHYARKYGELPLPDLHDLLSATELEGTRSHCCAMALKPSLGYWRVLRGWTRTPSIRCSRPPRRNISDGRATETRAQGFSAARALSGRGRPAEEPNPAESVLRGLRGDLQRFLDTTLGQIDRLASKNGIPRERLYAASVRHGNDGDPVIVELQSVIPMQRWLADEGEQP